MNTINSIEGLKWRYATKDFDATKKVDDQTLELILESGNLMPTAYGLQPFRFVVIENQEVKESLVPHSYGQQHVAVNSHLVVIAVRTDIDDAMISEYISRVEKTRGLAEGSAQGFKDAMIGDLTNRTPEGRLVWAQKQAYLALGGLMVGASELKVDNHAMEGFDAGKYNELLGLTEKSLHATVVLALGYRENEEEVATLQKVRVALEDMVIKM